MIKVWLKRIFAVCLVIGLFCAAVIIDVQARYIGKLSTNPTAFTPAPVAIVLGAFILPDGTPSDALRDRLLIGAYLYRQKIAKQILITGDDGLFHVDEIKSMKAFLLAQGIPSEDILTDGHGYRTYESCKRAKQVYHIDHAIIVTQRFHIGRALYLCNQFGIDAWGVSADLTTYKRIFAFTVRDIAASFKAWLDINILHPVSPVQQIK